jgi:hypothetical protein
LLFQNQQVHYFGTQELSMGKLEEMEAEQRRLKQKVNDLQHALDYEINARRVMKGDVDHLWNRIAWLGFLMVIGFVIQQPVSVFIAKVVVHATVSAQSVSS